MTIVARLVGAIATVMALLGIATPSVAAADAPLKIRFVMPTTPADYLLPYFVAQDLGWLRKWGLEVEESVVTGDAASTRAVLAGAADVTFVGVGPVLFAAAEGGNLKIIGSWQPVVDYVYVVRAGQSPKIEELADKRWAAAGPGGLSTALPKMLLKKYGSIPARRVSSRSAINRRACRPLSAARSTRPFSIPTSPPAPNKPVR
jgi:ABC-type nitrate/sulfonate/bicarbonate transport system substrate-binding protein